MRELQRAPDVLRVEDALHDDTVRPAFGQQVDKALVDVLQSLWKSCRGRCGQ